MRKDSPMKVLPEVIFILNTLISIFYLDTFYVS